MTLFKLPPVIRIWTVGCGENHSAIVCASDRRVWRGLHLIEHPVWLRL